MNKTSHADTVIPGYYYNTNRCYYLTGSKKGNKWIDLTYREPEWWGFAWMCIPSDSELDKMKFSETNPTKYKM